MSLIACRDQRISLGKYDDMNSVKVPLKAPMLFAPPPRVLPGGWMLALLYLLPLVSLVTFLETEC